MSQADQFPADLHAPPDWVGAVEGRTSGPARWQDGSYGNDAAPSWVLVDDAGNVHAQAFYYAPANAERFDSRFGVAPYVALSILRDEEIDSSCVLEPGTFVAALAAQDEGPSPIDILLGGLRAAGPVHWDRDA